MYVKKELHFYLIIGWFWKKKKESDCLNALFLGSSMLEWFVVNLFMKKETSITVNLLLIIRVIYLGCIVIEFTRKIDNDAPHWRNKLDFIFICNILLFSCTINGENVRSNTNYNRMVAYLRIEL